MADKGEIKVQGSIIKSGWLAGTNPNAPKEQYTEKVRSGFLASDLYSKQLSKDPRNPKQASQFVESYLNDPKMASTIQMRPVPAPKERSVDPANSFEGLIKIRKNGLCGIAIKKEKVDVTVNKEKVVTLTRRSDKFMSYFEGDFDELKFKDLKNEIAKQDTPEKKLALKGKEEYIVEDVYNGQYKYFITFSDQAAEHPHRIFVYLKDDDEIAKFKNTVLELSKIGERKLEDKHTKTLRDFINTRKILISGEIFKCMQNAEAGLANPVEYTRPAVELVDPNRIVITPKKFLVLADEEKLPGYEYYIAITDQAIQSRQIKGGLPDSNKINLTACPQVPSQGTLPTEFTAVSTPNHRFDLTGKVGKFITIYCVANKEVRSAGSVEITTSLPVAFSLNIVDEKLKTEGDKKVPIESKFTIVREGTDFSSIDDNLIEEIADPHYFGILRRTFSGEKNSADLSFQLSAIKRQLKSIHGQGLATAALEDHGFRNIEWDMFEKLITLMHKNVGWTGAPGEEFVYDQASFRKKMAEHVENYQPDPSLDNSVFLYFDRNKWSTDQAFAKTYSFYQKAVVYGPPNYLYMPVWKSLGKTPLLKHLVRNIVENQMKKGEDAYRALREDGEKLLVNNLSLSSDLVEFFKTNSVSADNQTHIREVIQAYLSLSGLMEDITSEEEENKKGLILDGFSLKCINGLVNIVKHLVDLYNISKANASKDPRCASLQKEDVFWVLFGIAMAFLPEHFLASVFYFEHTERTQQFHLAMKRFGINIAKMLNHKAFVSDKQAGTLKLANILSNLVKKDSPDVYKKMNDLGFPFKIYCIESIESLFSSQFNKDCLYKIWNAVFFEGADNAKRRGQQILLSAILVLIKRSRFQILKAKSAGEIDWILHTTGAQSFDSSEFLSEIFQARINHLVREDTASKGPMEKILSVIGDKIHEDYAALAKSNISYLNWLNKTNSAIESKGKIDVKQMVDFFQNWESQTSMGGVHSELLLNDQKSKTKVKLLDKFMAPSVTYSIVYTNLGTCVPQETSVEFLVIGGTERKLLKYGDPNWFNKITKEGKFEGINSIEVRVQTTDKSKGKMNTVEIIQFDLLKSNKDTYFDLTCGTLHITISLRLNNPKIQTDETDYFTKADKDFESFEDPLYLKLANSLGIKKGDYYKDELLNSSTNQKTFEQAMKAFYSSESVRVPSDTAFLQDDLLSKNHANLFELFVRVIIFSPLTNYTRLTQLYTLLLKLDQTGSEKRIKRSHAEFLVWYILRLSLVPISLGEVNSKCNSILHSSDVSIVSAFISSGTKKYDCSNIFSLWLVAQKKQQSNCILTLGQNGKLDLLQKALQFWSSNDEDAKSFTAEKENTLRVVANTSDGSKVFEFNFDESYRLLIDKKAASITGVHCLALQNSEEMLTFEDFSFLLSRFDMLDWVLSKLSSCASDALHLKISREAPGKGSSKDLKATVRVKLDSEEIGVATFLPLNPKRNIDPVETSLEAYLFENENLFSFNKTNIPVRQVESLTGSISLRSLLKEALEELRCEVLNKLDQSKSSLGYKRSSLALFYISVSTSKVVLNNKLLTGSSLDLDLDSLIRTNNLSSAFSVTLECVETEQRRYTSYAKDVRLIEGIEDLEFPFSPCHIVSQDQNYAQVVFRGETGKD